MCKSVVSIGCLVGFCLAPHTALAQKADAYPDKPVRVILPFAPGGAVDIIARAYGQKFADKFGQSWIYDNRGGAGTTIGAELVAKSPANGYTLLLTTVSHTVSPSIYKSLPYHAERDFAPLTTVVNVVAILAVTPALAAANVQELIALAKAKPGQLSFASAGTGTVSQFQGELFKLMAGINMMHVPYKGTGPAFPDLVSGRVQLIFEPMPTMLPHVRAGRMRALGVTTAKRSGAAPDIPTIAEQGLADFDVVVWYGAFAPAGTPNPLLEKLHSALVEFAGSDYVRERLATIGAEPATLSRAEFASMIKRDIARWGRVAREAGVVPQ